MKQTPALVLKISYLLFGFLFSVGVLNAATYPIIISDEADVREKWAASELSTFLGEIYEEDDFPVKTSIPRKGSFILLGTLETQPSLGLYVEGSQVEKPGSFVVNHGKFEGRTVGVICGNNSRGLLDGVYSFLEQTLGYGFYLHSNAKENVEKGAFSFEKWDFFAHPEFQERVVFNWYNFITGVSGWNLEDYKHWIRQCARMRYTQVMLHAYSWSPFHEFSYNGETKQVLRIQNTQYGAQWDNKQTPDIRELIGGELFTEEGPVFGADVGKIGFDGVTLENRVEKSKAMMREVIDYAVNTVGLEFNWAMDIDTGYANPQNVIQTLPEDSRIRMWDLYLARPDTDAGYLYYKNMVETVMNDYPAITNITVWWRSTTARLYDGLANALTYDKVHLEIPDDWKIEYDAAPDYVKGPSPDKPASLGTASLHYSKVTQAFRKALNEMGKSEVKLGYGSWIKSNENFTSFVPANYFQDPENTAYALEYMMSFDENVEFRNRLKKYGEKRNLVVIEWAHHDDGKYMGRPYTPPTDFSDKLNEVEASGFGVIHWLSRPFDVFFKNLQNQVWSNSLNEDYALTTEAMALDYFGASEKEKTAAYLHQWATEAPQFGRETGQLGQTGVEDFEARIQACDDRLAMLAKIDVSQFSEAALNRYKYFFGHEEWMKLFHEAQQTWDIDLQKEAIHKFIEKALVDGGMTRGEQGLLIQHNIKWLDKRKEHERMQNVH